MPLAKFIEEYKNKSIAEDLIFAVDVYKAVACRYDDERAHELSKEKWNEFLKLKAVI